MSSGSKGHTSIDGCGAHKNLSLISPYACIEIVLNILLYITKGLNPNPRIRFRVRNQVQG